MMRTNLLLALLVSSCFAMYGQVTMWGPSPYLSQADIPVGFYAAGSPSALEDFEDAIVDDWLTPSNGVPTGPGGNTDAVDADDGVIDGLGTAGRSFFIGIPLTSLTFTFEVPVKEAALVWTDGEPSSTWVFEAIGQDGSVIGSIGPLILGDGTTTGTTAEDRFFGVTAPDGVIAIRMSRIGGTGGLEVDHVQIGEAVPCADRPAPQNLAASFDATSLTLSWDPVINSVGCQLEVRKLPSGPTVFRIVPGVEVSSLSVPLAVLPPMTTWDWRNRCACTVSPTIDATPFSPFSTFTIPALKPVAKELKKPEDSRID